MSAVFRAPSTPAEERLGNDPTSELWGEHRSRYRHVVERGLAGGVTVDVACGAGIGLTLLREHGVRALGFDLDVSALRALHAAYPRLPLAVTDAQRLPLPNASVDSVVSFETIEHVPDAAATLREFQRVLRDSGTLVLSTPNRLFGPPEHHQNPFHVREFSGEELEDLLRESFAEVTIHGQWVAEPYRFVPFLMVDPQYDLSALAWKLYNRLPYAAKEALSRTLTGRSFYPGERDYRFIPHAWAGAHALLAIARRPISG